MTPIQAYCTYCGARPGEQCVDNWGMAVPGAHSTRTEVTENTAELIQEAEVARAEGRRPRKVTMMDVHGALSNLLYAAHQQFPGLACSISYNGHTYLQLEVGVSTKKQEDYVNLILARGIILDKYDYRFTSVATPLGYAEHEHRVITASVDLGHERRPPPCTPAAAPQYEHARGSTIAEMRANAQSSPLYARGDMRLVWVSEADVCAAELAACG